MTQPVHSITDAPLKHSVEQRSRMVRYTVAMSIRIVCFMLAAVVAVVWETWWAMAFATAAIVLPYIAVVDANASGQRYVDQRQAPEPAQRQVASGHQEPEAEPRQWWESEDLETDQEHSASGSVIEGEVVREAGPKDTAEEQQS
ncbi:DUF3099 domain-containing protein [Nesterenkonia sp.]|uniref:DUF3099 domain-containing protein n=1 Tax=Nesterenkonia sp. TaxID=704201 RepID=UPI002622C4A9|nr:DUF3099 domain-containing protein [Nesterenkonia sp.]